MGSKELKILEDNGSRQDRISALPDSLIHCILSFLPLTKDAIRTSVLSKRWQKQWTHVPVFVFDFLKSYTRMSQISSLIDNTLNLSNCSKIKKLHMELLSWYNDPVEGEPVGPIPDPQEEEDVDSMFDDLDSICDEKLRFAITKEVEEIFLNFRCMEMFTLPNFVFNSASLVKLHVSGCVFNPVGTICWPNLKHLYANSGWFRNQSIESVVSGSPLLESLEVQTCDGLELLVIASKSLKRLVLRDLNLGEFVLKISCPNLVEFCATKNCGNSLPQFRLCGAIPKDPFHYQGFKGLVIDSDSLKRLVLAGFLADSISVSCPNLEEFNLYSLKFEILKLIRLPSSSISVDFDFLQSNASSFYFFQSKAPSCAKNLQTQVLRQLDGVKELKMGPCFIKSLSALEIAGVSPSPQQARDPTSFPPVQKKCLILNCGPNFVEYLPGIAYALRTSPELEKLVITLELPEYPTAQDHRNLYWNPKGGVFDCLVSHLKIVKVVGISEKDDKNSLVLNVVEYLLKNGRVLEKLVVEIQDGASDDFVSKVSQKLLGCQKYSQHVIVELV